MRRWTWVLPLGVAAALALVAWPTADARSPSAPAAVTNWTQIWGDEFSAADVDRSKWVVGDASEPNYDGGINYYNPANVYQVNDHLVILSNSSVKRSNGKTYYASGRVTTKGKFAFLYGKVEVRAKLPGTRGLWPAIWMLPDDGSWPPEIDIMEMLGSDPRRVYMSLHYGTRKRQRDDQTAFFGPDFTADYHVFALEWTPGLLRWLVDGVERKRTTANVPDKAMYLRINTSVGGDWPGNPTRQTVLPQYFSIDYVRVYKAG